MIGINVLELFEWNENIFLVEMDLVYTDTSKDALKRMQRTNIIGMCVIERIYALAVNRAAMRNLCRLLTFRNDLTIIKSDDLKQLI